MTIVYAVVRTVGGYAREDADQAACDGVFSTPELAEKVRKVTRGQVVAIELDHIFPGYRAHYKEIFGKEITE
jgi:hypothetical protein